MSEKQESSHVKIRMVKELNSADPNVQQRLIKGRAYIMPREEAEYHLKHNHAVPVGDDERVKAEEPVKRVTPEAKGKKKKAAAKKPRKQKATKDSAEERADELAKEKLPKSLKKRK